MARVRLPDGHGAQSCTVASQAGLGMHAHGGHILNRGEATVGHGDVAGVHARATVTRLVYC